MDKLTEARSRPILPVPRWWLGVATTVGLVAGWLL